MSDIARDINARRRFIDRHVQRRLAVLIGTHDLERIAKANGLPPAGFPLPSFFASTPRPRP